MATLPNLEDFFNKLSHAELQRLAGSATEPVGLDAIQRAWQESKPEQPRHTGLPLQQAVLENSAPGDTTSRR